jgi:hypothetical protein
VKAIAARENICDSNDVGKSVVLLSLAPLLGGCVVATVAKTAVDVATLPVRVVSAGVDTVTTSQSEADEKRGRELREADERKGREARRAADRCRKGKPLPTDDCEAVSRRY